MAFIIVDSGSYWAATPAPTGTLLRAGTHETNDPNLIDEILLLGNELPHVHVLDASITAEAGADGGEPHTEVIVEATPQDRSGKLTKADLKPEVIKEMLVCNICNDGRSFGSAAALSSHRRSRHPEVDPSSGLPRQGVPVVQPQPEAVVDPQPEAPAA